MMKHVLLLTLLFCSANLSAQSLIVTAEGNPITGYEVEVTSSGVFYKSENNADSPFVKLNKSNVLMIRHADGNVVNLSESTTSNTTSTAQSSVVTDANSIHKEMNPDDYLDHEYNTTVIAKYNTPAKVTFIKESDKKRAVNRAILQHYATEDSQFASKDLIVSYKIIEDNVLSQNGGKYLKWIDGLQYKYLPRVYIQLENKSNVSIFVDLANTFLIRNGDISPYYVPEAFSSTEGRSAGANVNLGSVAKTVGVGGAVGSMARGVNVGSTKSNYTTITTYSQRIIVIPPKSTYKLAGKDLIVSKELRRDFFYRDQMHGVRLVLSPFCYPKKLGDFVEWDESNTIYKISNFLTYSFCEDLNNTYTLSSTLYLKRIIGSRYGGIPNVDIEMKGSSIGL